MLFRRRTKKTAFAHIRDFLWPSSGWGRSISYLRHRVGRISGSPHNIALGIAVGAAFSFTPFLGAHLILSAVVAWILGGSIVSSAVGTLVGNPWTFPLIWIADYRLGCWILGISNGAGGPTARGFRVMMEHPLDALMPIFGPLTVGSVPLGIAAALIIYWPARGLVAEYQIKRAERLRKKRDKSQVNKEESLAS
ncbi:MAG TPA: DUF2062 domain-containing protein [Alphaproteobacteria bacterium]|nr:DUF2062 domain-containing protein [Alphaproteobacteria bacterium]